MGDGVAANRPDGQHCQRWLWSAPAKALTRRNRRGARASQLNDNQAWIGTWASSTYPRAPLRPAHGHATSSISARIKEPARTVEMACFLRYCLLTATDQFIPHVPAPRRRSLAPMCRRCGCTHRLVAAVPVAAAGLARAGPGEAGTAELRMRLLELVAARRAKAPSRASGIRRQLIASIAPVRSLLVAAGTLSWTATGGLPGAACAGHPAHAVRSQGQDLAGRGHRRSLGRGMAPGHRRRRPRANVPSAGGGHLFALRRGLRNRLDLDRTLPELPRPRAAVHLAGAVGSRGTAPLRQAAVAGQGRALPRTAVGARARRRRRGGHGGAGRALRVDDELHLAPLAAETRTPKSAGCAAGSISASARCSCPRSSWRWTPRFASSWIMLGREPRSGQELLMVYAGILAHGTSLTAAECARSPAAVGHQHPPRPCAGPATSAGWPSLPRRCWSTCNANRSPPPGAAPIWPRRT